MIGNFLRKLSRSEWILLLVFFLFSAVLMVKTFGVTEDGNIRIAAKAWSDYAATLPLIRSFSFGDNFPPEYPIFAGPPIRYHFVFFAITGFLEKIGVRLDIAFNGLSILAFFLLLSAIYFVGKIVFKNKTVGFLAVVLFLFNGSFGFLEYFSKYSFWEAVGKIPQNTDFSSFGPYDGKIVSAFWNLNIYTNQRHLALGYAFYLLYFLTIYYFSRNPKKFSINKAIILGTALGVFPFVHLSIFLVTGLSLFAFLILYPKIRSKILIAGITAIALAIPQILYMGKSEVETQLFRPGYLVNPLTFIEFSKYWFFNFGLTVLIAPLGFIMSEKEQRKIIIPFILFFILGNLLQLSPDMPTNHKFFNLTLIGLNFYTAFFLLKLWGRGVYGKIVFPFLFLLLTLTGIIDLFPILNDRSILLEDIPNNKTAAFIKESTPRDAVFLNSSFLYDPASLAGRKIYLGWPYFSWSAGFDTTNRLQKMKTILASKTKNELCQLIRKENIDYVEIEEPTPIAEVEINYNLFKSIPGEIYYNPESNLRLISVAISCS